MLKIIPILCRAGKMDNYAYLLIDKQTNISAVLDPSEAEPVIKECEKQNIKPVYILNTHHHFDHIEGNKEIKDKYSSKIVVSINDLNIIPSADIGLEEGDIFNLGNSKAHIISAEGHAVGHILWYFPSEKNLFTGDILFNLAVGGLFEGTAEQMWHSLQKIKKLPDDVLFYPGHEYAVYGLNSLYGPTGERYAAKVKERLSQGIPTAPFTLGEEKICNPYLSCSNYQEFYEKIIS